MQYERDKTIPFARQSLQRELQALHMEIATMNNVASSVMAEAATDSRELIRHTSGAVNKRPKTLEEEARDREEELQLKNTEWKIYQVRTQSGRYIR